jgi:hypothetical protein
MFNHALLKAVLIAAAIALSSCASNPYNSTPLFLFHEGDNVQLDPDSCVIFDYFPYLCNRPGVVVDYRDIKNRCYPKLSYVVRYNGLSNDYLFCASDLILLPEKSTAANSKAGK